MMVINTTSLVENRPVLLAGLLSAMSYAFLAWQSRDYGDANLFHLILTVGCCAFIVALLWWYYHKQNIDIPVAGLLGFAVLFRVIGWVAFPVLEDDFYRYLWDGRAALELGTPYGHIPADFFDSDLLGDHFDQILGLINYPDLATIYGPVMQWVFALSYWLAPGQVWPLQMLAAVADFALILVLLRLAKPNYVLLYAWSPLVIKEFAFTAHPDVIGSLFLTMAFAAYLRKRFVLVGMLLALATGVKIFALLLVPIFLGWQWRGWLAFLATSILVALPWGIADAWFPAGLQEMSSQWLFNAPIYLLLIPYFSIASIKLVLLAVLAMICAAYYFYCMSNWQYKAIRADLLFAALFLCLPAFNAWYLVWLLPFATIYPSLWAWVASVVVLVAYASGINLPDSGLGTYAQPLWLVLSALLLIVLAAVLDSKFKSKFRLEASNKLDQYR